MVDIAEESVHLSVSEMSNPASKTGNIAHKIDLKRVYKSCNSYTKISEAFQKYTIIISITTYMIGMSGKPERKQINQTKVWRCSLLSLLSLALY